jgi:hypothetical protein
MNKNKFIKKIETIKMSKVEILEIKNTVTELKNTIESFNSSLGQKNL